MNGGPKLPQATMSTDPYWQEYVIGWDDANSKIIGEARTRNLNENKQFLSE